MRRPEMPDHEETDTMALTITVTFDPNTTDELIRWRYAAAAEVNPDHPDLTVQRALKAMVHVMLDEPAVSNAVIDRLRHEQ
jgi:hypothetical protein